MDEKELRKELNRRAGELLEKLGEKVKRFVKDTYDKKLTVITEKMKSEEKNIKDLKTYKRFFEGIAEKDGFMEFFLFEFASRNFELMRINLLKEGLFKNEEDFNWLNKKLGEYLRICMEAMTQMVLAAKTPWAEEDRNKKFAEIMGKLSELRDELGPFLIEKGLAERPIIRIDFRPISRINRDRISGKS